MVFFVFSCTFGAINQHTCTNPLHHFFGVRNSNNLVNTVHGLCTEALGTLSEVGCVVFHVHLRNSSIQSTLVIDLLA